MADGLVTVVLVEGESDRQAVLAAARAFDGDVAGGGVEVVAMGGATNIERHVQRLDRQGLDVEVLGLCDAGELRHFERWLDPDDIFVCHADLEEELIRSLGVNEMVEFIESQGELKRFRTFQKQIAQRDRSLDHHVYRFCGIRAGRKVRYAREIVERLDAAQIPSPLASLVAAAY